MKIEKEFDIDAYDISKVISETEMKELCEDYYGLDKVVNLFTPDEILNSIETSDIIKNVAIRFDFDICDMLEEFLSLEGNDEIKQVIEWLESYGYKVTKE